MTLAGAFMLLLAAGAAPPAPTTQPGIDPTADAILRESCDFLAQTKAFSVHAELWKDVVLASGHKIQVTRTVDLDVRRPDRFYADARAHQKGRAIWYDGKSLTVLDRQNNLYSVVNAPDTIDQTLDLASQTYGITVPLEDLAVSDPYASSIKNATAGGYFGEEPVLGVMCRHVSFATDQIDWQLWVADAPAPLPQKLVITYKNQEQSPQFTFIFSKWSLADRAADVAFRFIPPPRSTQIPLLKQNGGGEQP